MDFTGYFIDQYTNILMHRYLIYSIDTHYVLRYIDASQYCPISSCNTQHQESIIGKRVSNFHMHYIKISPSSNSVYSSVFTYNSYVVNRL